MVVTVTPDRGNSHHLGLKEDNRVRILNGREEETLGIGRASRHHHLDPCIDHLFKTRSHCCAIIANVSILSGIWFHFYAILGSRHTSRHQPLHVCSIHAKACQIT